MEKIKIYVVGGDTDYANWIHNSELVDSPEDATIVLFTGGEDVDPSIYGKKKHANTFSNLDRDLEEKKIFDSMQPHQLALGICRGSQFLCALNGGILIQDCVGHARWDTHSITNGEKITEITSTHHQMQYPWTINKGDFDILYWAAPSISHYYEGDGVEGVPSEPEIVLYHVGGNPKCLAIQGHPEIMRKDAPVIEILNNLIESCLTDDL